MKKVFSITGTYEGPDEEYFAELAEEQKHLGTWTIDGAIATCIFNATTLQEFDAMLKAFGDALSSVELETMQELAAGDEDEINRGWGCTYTFCRLK